MEDTDVSRDVLVVLVACIVRRHKRHNADSIDCVPQCQAMRRFQLTETEGNEKNIMISYEEEIKRFKPSLDVDQIEDAIAKVDLTDMNDIMTSLIEEAIKHKKDEIAK